MQFLMVFPVMGSLISLCKMLLQIAITCLLWDETLLGDSTGSEDNEEFVEVLTL